MHWRERRGGGAGQVELSRPQVIPREDDRTTIEARAVQEVTPDSVQLAREQTEGNGAVATVYKVKQTGQEFTREQLEAEGQELKKLCQRLTSMRLNGQGVLEIQIAINEKPRWVAICPEQNRQALIWHTHQMSHSGVGRTIAQLQLTWYWWDSMQTLRGSSALVRCVRKPSPGDYRQQVGDDACMLDALDRKWLLTWWDPGRRPGPGIDGSWYLWNVSPDGRTPSPFQTQQPREWQPPWTNGYSVT